MTDFIRRPHKQYGPVNRAKKKKASKRARRQARQLRKASFTPGADPCPRCGSYEIEKSIQTFSNGTMHIRVTCQSCEKFFKWVPHDEFLEY